MVKTVIICYFLLALIDTINIIDFKKLVFSFLLSKHNLKGAKKIHKAQSKWDRFTLSYVGEHTVYSKQFRFYYKLRLAYIASIIPIYLITVIVGIVFGAWGAIIACLVAFIFNVIIAIIVTAQFNAKRISRFDKRYE